MNKTYCGGKFVFKDEMDEEDLKRERELDAYLAKEEMAIDGKEILKTVKRDRKLCRKVREAVFAYIGSLGYGVTDVEIVKQHSSKRLESEEIVHFRVKGFWLGDYDFGMWILPYNFYRKKYEDMSPSERKEFDNTPYCEMKRMKTVVQIFQQHKDSLDRLTPARSDPVIEIGVENVKELLDGLKQRKSAKNPKREYGEFGFDIEDLGHLLEFMRRHPFKHFGGLLSHGDRLVSYSGYFDIEHPLLWFVKERTAFHFKRIVKGVRRWFGLRKAIRVCKGLSKEDCVKRIVMASFGNCVCPGCLADYEFEITVVFDGTHTLKEFSEAFDRHITEDDIGLTGRDCCVARVMTHVGLTVDGGRHDKRKKKHLGGNKRHLGVGGTVLLNFHGSKNDEKTYKKLVGMYENVRDGVDCDARRALLSEHPTMESFLKSHEFDPVAKRPVRCLARLTDRDCDILETLD